ncbi:hypothetical protein [uncultured Mucilaginibacter sp.]|uniref:hypothetical protein n=1 Tax=uncultured Mucilaginibacter sp. TaxID=797541 RepID=UPI0025D10C3E|nr:hypothetical protein [uncultured Mucilaginibacter sp.]
MDDTPLHVKQLQLAIWLAKPPEERLRHTLEDNDALFAFWDEIKKNNQQNKSGDQVNKPGKL